MNSGNGQAKAGAASDEEAALLNELLEPQGNLVQVTFDHFDMILKVEMLLYQVKQLFFWISFTELVAFVVSAVLLLSIERHAVFVLYFGHFVRSIAGFFIYNSMPKINEFMKDVKSNIDADRLLEALDVRAMQ